MVLQVSQTRPRSCEGSQSCVCWYHRNSLRLKLDAASALQMKMNPSNTQTDPLPRAHHPHTRSCSEVIHSPTTQKEEMISPNLHPLCNSSCPSVVSLSSCGRFRKTTRTRTLLITGGSIKPQYYLKIVPITSCGNLCELIGLQLHTHS